MRTMYDKTFNFIQRTGTLIDLAEVRRRQAPTQRDSLARRFEAEGRLPEPVEEESAFRPVVLTTTPAQRRRARRERQAWRLDVCASLSVIFVTLVFALLVIL